jgi:hypothetical protein
MWISDTSSISVLARFLISNSSRELQPEVDIKKRQAEQNNMVFRNLRMDPPFFH